MRTAGFCQCGGLSGQLLASAQHMLELNTAEVAATHHTAEHKSINLLASCRSLEGAYTGSKSAGKHGRIP